MQDILSLKPNSNIGDLYEGSIVLPAWKNFQSRQGAYGSKDSHSLSDGKIKVFINGRQSGNNKVSTEEQAEVIRYLAANDERVRDAILQKIMEEMPEIKEIYEDLVPEINSPEDLKNLVGLSTIHIMHSDKDGVAYIGYELGCDWDNEHGIGVMMHKDRVVEIGHATTAFDPWVTYSDNGTLEEETENCTQANNIPQEINAIIKRPWWKIW